jgi:hypothetical protein
MTVLDVDDGVVDMLFRKVMDNDFAIAPELLGKTPG